VIALVSIVRFVAAHWRATVAALLAVALFAVGWHYGAARVTAEWRAEKTAAAQEQAKAASAALDKQQATEAKVATIDQQFNDEVSKHANDVLAYRAQLATGAERLSVHVAACVPAADEGTSAAGGVDDGPATANLAPAAADGVAEVAGDDQREIDKLRGLEAYVRAMQDQGYIERGDGLGEGASSAPQGASSPAQSSRS
jgi:hypothetical protein